MQCRCTQRRRSAQAEKRSRPKRKKGKRETATGRYFSFVLSFLLSLSFSFTSRFRVGQHPGLAPDVNPAAVQQCASECLCFPLSTDSALPFSFLLSPFSFLLSPFSILLSLPLILCVSVSLFCATFGRAHLEAVVGGIRSGSTAVHRQPLLAVLLTHSHTQSLAFSRCTERAR